MSPIQRHFVIKPKQKAIDFIKKELYYGTELMTPNDTNDTNCNKCNQMSLKKVSLGVISDITPEVKEEQIIDISEIIKRHDK